MADEAPPVETTEDPPPVDLAALLARPAVPEVVAVLRRMLADAEAGEVIAVAIANVGADNSFTTGFAGDEQVTLLGGLAHLMYRINRDLETT